MARELSDMLSDLKSITAEIESAMGGKSPDEADENESEPDESEDGTKTATVDDGGSVESEGESDSKAGGFPAKRAMVAMLRSKLAK